MFGEVSDVCATRAVDVERPGQLFFGITQGTVADKHATSSQAADALAGFCQLEQCVVGFRSLGLVHAGSFALDNEQPVTRHEGDIKLILDIGSSAVADVQITCQVAEGLKDMRLQPAALDEITLGLAGKNDLVSDSAFSKLRSRASRLRESR